MRALTLTIAVCMVMALAACGEDDSTTDTPSTVETTVTVDGPGSLADTSTKPTVIVPKGVPPQQLPFSDIVKGKGPEVKAGDEVTVHYVGVGFKSEEEFDASWDRDEPLVFELGAGEVIKGWDLGLRGMKAGGRRELVVPPNLAYGQTGRPPAIGPNEPLVFVVDLIAIE